MGATLIYLVTGTHPADLPQKDFQIQFEPAANISPTFVNWLKWMTQPSLDRRLTSARTALQILENPPQTETVLTVSKPAGSKISLTKSTNSLEIIIPSNTFRPAATILCLFAIAWISGVAIFTFGILSLHLFALNLFFVLFSLPFWAIGFYTAYLGFLGLFGRIHLCLNQQQISLTDKLFGFKKARVLAAPKQYINKLLYIPQHYKYFEGIPVEVKAKLMIWAGVHNYEIGGNDGFINNEAEIEWLAYELSDWLGLPIIRK